MTPPKAALFFLAAALFVAGPSACRRDRPEPSGGDSLQGAGADKNTVVLQAAGTDYRLYEFEDFVTRTVGSLEESLSPTALSRLFDGFVDDALLLEKARAQGIDLSEQEIRDYLVRVKGQAGLDRNGAPAEADLNLLRNRLLVEKYTFLLVKDISVTEDEVKSYYEDHKSEFFKPERFEVSQILTDSEETAVQVLGRVRGRSFQEFEQAAREISIGVEAVRGGRMGVFSRGQLPFEIERVILSLELGHVSRVVESSYGFHVFLLTRRFDPELETLESAAPGIRLKILDRKISQALAAHLEEVKAGLDWNALTQNLPFKYQRNQP